ncbi:ClpP/crotonase-like domain-containing protein [Lipomyces oligophaga]|uniref:ClpP/crotonase-like domain-containing protein n=1 Tax=Lipomyces oligophaga TaxID=45792 RepID=UPI0034CF073D
MAEKKAQLPLLFQVYDEVEKGTIAVSKSDSNLYYLISFNCPPDNRLTPDMILTLMRVLDLLETEFLPIEELPVVTTSSIQKFYSNGLDLELALRTPDFFDLFFNPLCKRLLEYPVPCIALINGHAFAGGLMIAMCHDYRIMNPSKGFLCLNEIEFGSPLKASMSAIFNKKTSALVFRKLVMEAHRFTADIAIQDGLVDAKGTIVDVDMFIKSRRLEKLAKSPSYGPLKSGLWKDIIKYCDSTEREENKLLAASAKIEEQRKAYRLRQYIRPILSKL